METILNITSRYDSNALAPSLNNKRIYHLDRMILLLHHYTCQKTNIIDKHEKFIIRSISKIVAYLGENPIELGRAFGQHVL
jgi:hypothetical protein